MLFKIQSYEKDLEKLRISEQLAKLAAQVSHDIRSPLSALNLVYSNLSEISEEKRLLIRRSIQRINDIANDLLAKGKSPLESSGFLQRHKNTNSLLYAEVDSIISEKRIEFRDKSNVDISVIKPELAYGIFSEINSIEFKRIVSNLINNSVEALNGASGTINVFIGADDDKTWITVSDNGPGIPDHILSKLGQMAISFGKEQGESGSGLGILHAKKSIENMGGKLEIESKLNHGASITMTFPRTKVPSWFVEKINLSKNCVVVSLDDDTAIHGLWMSKLKDTIGNKNDFEFFNFASMEKLIEWYFSRNADELNRLFLIDFEILGQEKNGIDLIEKLGIASQSILVTSRCDDQSIKERCEKLKIKMIPKEIAGFTPIQYQVKEVDLDYILIDDDSLVLSMWNFNAKNKNHKIKLYDTFQKFEIEAETINKDTAVYIDSNLGSDETGKILKGEELALSIVNLGFTNIYLTTGESPDQFSSYPYIKGIVGKDPINTVLAKNSPKSL